MRILKNFILFVGCFLFLNQVLAEESFQFDPDVYYPQCPIGETLSGRCPEPGAPDLDQPIPKRYLSVDKSKCWGTPGVSFHSGGVLQMQYCGARFIKSVTIDGIRYQENKGLTVFKPQRYDPYATVRDSQIERSFSRDVRSTTEAGVQGTCSDCQKNPLTEQIARVQDAARAAQPKEEPLSALDQYFKKECKPVSAADAKKDITCTPTEFAAYMGDPNAKPPVVGYKEYIEAAATAFDTPVEVLSCLAFQESAWNLKAGHLRNTRNAAKGLMQVSPEAISHMEKNLGDLTELYTDQSTDKVEAEKRILEGMSTYARSWHQYYNELKKENLVSSRANAPIKFNLCTKRSSECETKNKLGEENYDDRFDPKLNIGIGSLYYAKVSMGTRSTIKNKTNRDILAAALYNSGAGHIICSDSDAANKKCKKWDKTDIETCTYNAKNPENCKWVKSLLDAIKIRSGGGKRAQVKKHIITIQNCIDGASK